MHDLLPFLVIGIVSGAIYGMAAVGLVVSYKTSGVFNLAYGALATVAADVFYLLHVEWSMPWPFAALLAVCFLSPPMAWILEQIGRRARRQSLLVRIVATVGVLVLLEAASDLAYGSRPRQFPTFLPVSTVRILGTNVQWQQIIITAISLVITLGLWLFLKATLTGKALRAAVDDDELLAMTGFSSRGVQRLAWLIGCFTATITGLLLAPSLTLQAEVLTLLVVQAFGAVAVGRFKNLPTTWVAGVLIGVAASVLTKYASGEGIVRSLPGGLPFIVLFLVLLLYRKRWVGRDAESRPDRVPSWRPRLSLQLLGGAVLIAALAAAPQFVGYHLTEWTVALTQVLLLAALGLVVRSAREVSLCHVGFAAIGAVAFSKLVVGNHMPWGVALIVSGLVLVPVGALLSIPAIRLSGLYLALATFGFGVLLQQVFYQSTWMFGPSTLGLTMPMPDVALLQDLSGERFYYLVLAIVVVAVVALVVVTQSRFGRLLQGISQSRLASTTSGVSVATVGVLAFCLSAFLAGISGALSGAALGTVTGLNFDPMTSLLLVAVVLITPGELPWYAVIGGGLATLLPAYFSGNTATDVIQIAFGCGAVLYSLGSVPHLPARLQALLARRPATRTDRQRQGDLAALWAGIPSASFKIDDVTVRFGGSTALNSVSMPIEGGVVTGLIGPNGAGKTTLFNVCSGLLEPDAGELRYADGRRLPPSPSARARVGVGRTFQRMQLAEELTARRNIELAVEARFAGRNPLRALISSRRERDLIPTLAAEAMELCHLDDLADVLVRELPTGRRRLVELARVLVGTYTLILLDEPSSGLDERETAEFAQILTSLNDRHAAAILLVEHDMALVMKVSKQIHVLDFGNLVFSGTPAEVRASELVQQAYLGSEAAVTAEASAP